MSLLVFVIVSVNLIFLSLAAFGAVQAYRYWQMNSQLSRCGVNVEGHLIDLATRISANRDSSTTRYYLTYRYEYGGKEYTSKAQVERRHFTDVSAGMKVEVRCLPDYPQTACLVQYNMIPQIISSNIIYACGLPVIGLMVTILVIFFLFIAR
ncbi:MAG: DUF3592 domain-containing protein [Ktedonobacteraceae bacterium]